MDVTQTASNVAYGTSDTSAAASGTDPTMISSDFETFLKMLTVQMENQDPLNPIESSDYAVQLATFSGVEQQVRTNDLLQEVQAQLGVMSMSDLVGWVGMEARATAPVNFSVEPIEVASSPPAGATSAYMLVRNSAGNQVDRVEINLAKDNVTWAGLDPDGKLFASGQYTFHMQSYNSNGLISETQMAVYSEIVEAKVENGSTILVLETGEEIAASDVDALRDPNS